MADNHEHSDQQVPEAPPNSINVSNGSIMQVLQEKLLAALNENILLHARLRDMGEELAAIRAAQTQPSRRVRRGHPA